MTKEMNKTVMEIRQKTSVNSIIEKKSDTQDTIPTSSMSSPPPNFTPQHPQQMPRSQYLFQHQQNQNQNQHQHQNQNQNQSQNQNQQSQQPQIKKRRRI